MTKEELKKALRVYGVTNREVLASGISLEEAVSEAIRGGATMIQLREKELETKHGENVRPEWKELALRILAICREHRVPLLIDDDVALAREIDADGVHVGQSDQSCREARAILGEDKIIGVTAKTLEQALLAQEAGADYLGSGAIFGTKTKKDAVPMTKDMLKTITDAVEIPVVAIGGITCDNVSGLEETGVAGVAVISGLFAGQNIAENAKKLRKAVSKFHAVSV